MQASAPPPDEPDTMASMLARLLHDGDVDAAIEAGLMQWTPEVTDSLTPDDTVLLLTTQQRLREAWNARERHRARTARLARRKAERERHRAASSTPAAKPTLPAAAALALARARTKAGNRGGT